MSVLLEWAVPNSSDELATAVSGIHSFGFLHIRLREKDGVGNKVSRTEEALCNMLDTARP